MKTNTKKGNVAIKSKSQSYVNKPQSPKDRFFDEYLNLNTWKVTPMTESFIQKLGEELVTWARDNSDALKMEEWQVANGLCDDTKQRWLGKYPNFKKAWEQAKVILGIRREKGAMKNQYNVSMVAPMMAHYDNNWKVTAEWRAKLKGDAENKSERTIVVVPSYNEPEEEKPTPEEVAAIARKGMRQKSHKKKS